MESGGRFLIVRLSSFGDLLHALPAVQVIRRIYPDSTVDWIVQTPFDRLARWFTDVHRLWVLSTPVWRPHWMLRRALRHQKYEWAIDFQGLIKSAIWAWRSRARYRLGFHRADLREPLSRWLYNRFPFAHFMEKQGLHVIEKNVMLLTGLGLEPDRIFRELDHIVLAGGRSRWFTVPDETRTGVRTWLHDRGLTPRKFWVVHVYAARPEKTWSTQTLEALVRYLRNTTPYAVVLLTGTHPAERDRAARIVTTLGPSQLHLAPQWDWPALIEFLSHARAVIGPDTGILHLADCLGTPVVMTMGWFAAERNGPFFTRTVSQVVERPVTPEGWPELDALLEAVTQVIERLETGVSRLNANHVQAAAYPVNHADRPSAPP